APPLIRNAHRAAHHRRSANEGFVVALLPAGVGSLTTLATSPRAGADQVAVTAIVWLFRIIRSRTRYCRDDETNLVGRRRPAGRSRELRVVQLASVGGLFTDIRAHHVLPCS